MRKFVLVVLLWISAVSVFAQRDNQKWYLNGFGARIEFGASSNQLMGFEYDHFFRTKFDLSTLFISNFDNIYQGCIIGKYVASFPNIGSRLRWYGGGGIMAGGKPMYDLDYQRTGTKQVYVALTGALGIGYSFKKAPLNATIEWRPDLNVIYTHFQKNNANNERLQTAIVAATLRFITRNKLN